MSRGTLNAERAFAVSTWLLAAAKDETRARTEWESVGATLLRCGGIFTAVRVPGDLVKHGAGTDDVQGISEYLDETLHGGAVFLDNVLGLYYFLVPASTALRWKVPETKCFGRDHFIGVPRPGLPDRDRTARTYWALEMTGPGAMCVPGAVMQLVVHGRYRRAAAEEAAEANDG